MELCAGNLSDFCMGRYLGHFPADIEAMKQMLEGLAYLHEKRYVHRDVKPNNILISLHGTLKIADFGFCKPIGSSDNGSFSMSSNLIAYNYGNYINYKDVKQMQRLELRDG